MKNFLAIVSLCLFLNDNANAEWSFLENLENGSKFYTDIKTLKKDSGYIYIWTMTDLKEGMIGGDKEGIRAIFSYKEFKKIDCKLNRIENVQYIFYTGQMGTGKAKPFQREKQKWLYPPPGSSMGEFVRILCENY